MALNVDAPYHRVTERVIGCAITVHRKVGAGILEDPCKLALAAEMVAAGLKFTKELRLPFVYDGKRMPATYVMDFVVEDLVVLEIKSVAHLLPVHTAQLVTYLQLSGYPAGLLINFNVTKLVNGIRRVLNDKPNVDPSPDANQ
jgi:GxxExxY protein